MKKITFIIPAYNAETTIRRTVLSIEELHVDSERLGERFAAPCARNLAHVLRVEPEIEHQGNPLPSPAFGDASVEAGFGGDLGVERE